MRKYILFLGLILSVFLPQRLRADTYLSTDSLLFMLSTYDTATVQTLTNADSVVWYRLNYSRTRQRLGAQTTGNEETGVYSYMVAACSASSGSYAGFYAAYAKVYKNGKTAAKTTWLWKAVPGSGLRILSTNDSLQFQNWTFGTVTNVTNRVHTYNTDTSRVDLSNSFGTLAAAKFAADYWHNIAVYADSGATGSNPWSSAQRDSLLFGRWRSSGDSSNVALHPGDSVPAYLAPGDSGKLAAIKTKTDSYLDTTVSSRSTFNPATTRVHIYNTDTTRGDLSNSFGTLAAAKFAADYWHNIAVYADSGATGSNPWSSAQRDSLLFGRWRSSGDSSNVLFSVDNDTVKYVQSVISRVHVYSSDTTRPDLSNAIGTLAAAKYAADYWHNVAVYADSGASGSNPWSSGQRDSVLNVIADAGKLGTRSTFDPATTRVHVYNTDTTRVDLSNSFGTLAAAKFAADFWHAIAVYADSGSFADSVTAVGRVWSVLDKTGYALSTSNAASLASRAADSLNNRYSFSLLLPGLKMMGAVGDSQQYFYNASGLMDSMRYWSGATLVSRTLYVRTADSLAPRLTKTYSLP